MLHSYTLGQEQDLSSDVIYGLHHATAGIGHCNTFLTEKPLMGLLLQRQLGLNTYFSCTVVYVIDEANEWVSSKTNSSATG